MLYCMLHWINNEIVFVFELVEVVVVVEAVVVVVVSYNRGKFSGCIILAGRLTSAT